MSIARTMSSAMSERKDSFDSIPEVDFIQQSMKEEIDSIDGQIISDFKILELSGKLRPEPLLIPDKSRFVVFPIKHNDVRDYICTTSMTLL